MTRIIHQYFFHPNVKTAYNKCTETDTIVVNIKWCTT